MPFFSSETHPRKSVHGNRAFQSGVIPVTLPAHPASFLSSVLALAPEIIALSWLAFSDIAATLQQDVAEPSTMDSESMAMIIKLVNFIHF